jgi:outer membrane protein OmpA-like peptidoglycan-associated protein
MRFRIAALVVFAFLGGCAQDGKSFSILFQPYSSQLDPQAREAIHAAAAFANEHPLMPLSLQGYTTRPDPIVFGTLPQLRVAVVQRALVDEGVGQARIQVLGNGILYPRGVPMPELSRGQVDVNIGL